ncbi:MAG: endolytic transglycosylase MltG [Flavobacteriaceae bacterium]
MTRKTVKIISAVILVIGILFAYNLYQKIYQSNTVKKGVVYIKTDSSYEELLTSLTPFLKNKTAFNWVSKLKKFSKPKPGKYLIKKGLSNNTLINKLRNGQQTSVKLAFNNQHSLEHLAGRISTQIEADSLSLIKAFTAPDYLKKINFTQDEMLGVFVPNSYDFKWNTSAEQFRAKMYAEYQKFWNKSRLDKAKKLNLTPNQVISLAAIVHRETAKTSERPIVAGLYLNRVNNKWPLESDPTIIYAMNKKYGKDLKIRRVYFKYIEETKKSPYNTYKNPGIPPSPIAMPDISAIDAVLNAKNHDFYFMCASVTKIGYHEFAKTLAQHNRNRQKYIAKKNKQGVTH